MLAAMVESSELATQIILKSLENGLILFWLLFEGRAIRITPPLNISMEEIDKGCDILLKSIDEVLISKEVI
jgi:4-aminobutyrate aminotransferase-like enzyme